MIEDPGEKKSTDRCKIPDMDEEKKLSAVFPMIGM